MIAFNPLRRNPQFLIFGLIGAANTLIHGIFLVIFVEWLFWGVTVSHFFAFFAANVFSYIMNSKVTFKSNISIMRYAKFFLASLISLALTIIISSVSDFYGAHYLAGFFLVVLTVPVLNFLIIKFWAFSDQKGRA